MLDPSRYALDAATVGFRKRMKQTVNWGSFEKAVQTQTDAIKVRRELEETPISEIHVMGGGLYGIANDEKTKTYARQQRQINGYVLRSFLSNGGPIILPPKHGEGLLMTPMNMGQRQYGGYNSIMGNYVSSFTEPLQAPLDNNTMLLARSGIAMASNSATNPYARLQFNMNMHLTQAEINKNQEQFIEQRQYNVQKDIAKELRTEQDLQFSGKKRKELMAELGDRARTEAAPQNPINAAQRRGRRANVFQQDAIAAALMAENQSESESSRGTTASMVAKQNSVAKRLKYELEQESAAKSLQYEQDSNAKFRLAKSANNSLANLFLGSAPVTPGFELEESLDLSGLDYNSPSGASAYTQHGLDTSSYVQSEGEEKEGAVETVFNIRDYRTRSAQNASAEKNLQSQLSDGSMNAESLTNSTQKNILNVAKIVQSIEQRTATKSLFAKGANAVNQYFSPSSSNIKEAATPEGAIYIAEPIGTGDKYNSSRRTSAYGNNPIVPISQEKVRGNNSYFGTKRIQPEILKDPFSNAVGLQTPSPPPPMQRSTSTGRLKGTRTLINS